MSAVHGRRPAPCTAGHPTPGCLDLGRPDPGRCGPDCTGSVTAETALALPVVVLVLTVLLSTGSALLAQVRCVDAAREAARCAARGESVERVLATGRELAPAGSRVEIGTDGSRVRVTVTARVGLPFDAAVIPVGATSVSEREQP